MHPGRRDGAAVEVVMSGIVALVVLSMVGFAFLHLVIRARSSSSTLDRELIAIINRGTAELVGERLIAGPLLVPVTVDRRLRGPVMVLDMGTMGLRLRLYRAGLRPSCPADAAGCLARLLGITFVDGLGWRFMFDGPQGPQRYDGWLVERVESPNISAA